MPLCERVKMNKRKRSTVNEKPKYAEISSDEDNDSDETFECKYHIKFIITLELKSRLMYLFHL